MTEEIKRTPQEQAAYEEEWYRQSAVSLRFLRHNPTFIMNEANAQKIADWIRAHGGQWTDEAIEAAYESVKDSIEHGENPVPAAKMEDPLPDWGELRTRADINAIPKDLYREWMKNPQFVAEVNAILQKDKK